AGSPERNAERPCSARSSTALLTRGSSHARSKRRRAAHGGPGSSGRLDRSDGGRPRTSGDLLVRVGELEGDASAGVRFDPDAAAMGLHEATRDGEPEAGSAGGAGAAGVGAGEPSERDVGEPVGKA